MSLNSRLGTNLFTQYGKKKLLSLRMSDEISQFHCKAYVKNSHFFFLRIYALRVFFPFPATKTKKFRFQNLDLLTSINFTSKHQATVLLNYCHRQAYTQKKVHVAPYPTVIICSIRSSGCSKSKYDISGGCKNEARLSDARGIN